MLLTKSQVLKTEKRKYALLTVPELGGEIRIANLSAGTALRLKEVREANGTDREAALVMFEHSIVDEKNEPLFDEPAARQFLHSISIDTLNLIISSINGLSELGPKRKSANGIEKAGEAPAVNPSEAAPSESSPTA